MTIVGAVATGLLVQSNMGRPTKIEGNPEHPGTLGACDIFSQASVLQLYDPDRAQAASLRVRPGPDGEITGWGDFFGAFRRDSNVKASSEIIPAPVVASASAAAPSSNGTS